VALPILLAVSPITAAEHRFLRIHSPVDDERYADTAKIAVNGYLFLPDRKVDSDSVTIRVGYDRPSGKRFIIAHETTAELKPATNEKGMYPFVGDTKPKVPLETGRYLLRVDCLDKSGKGPPILATQSVFIEIENLKPKPKGDIAVTF
jgi:hypothetical protein